MPSYSEDKVIVIHFSGVGEEFQTVRLRLGKITTGNTLCPLAPVPPTLMGSITLAGFSEAFAMKYI